MQQAERSNLYAWAVGLWFMITTFAGLVFLGSYTGPRHGVVLWTNILLGVLASQPAFFAASESLYGNTPLSSRQVALAPKLSMAGAAGIILSIPGYALLGVETTMLMTVNTLASGVVIYTMARQADRALAT
ncbi:MAG: hypothetical protein SV186_04040 [Candidatus Nanohaloarchaea archaeon]|nr:hypothetical protein [Candidatus Nanohaloarchaea archaeon]